MLKAERLDDVADPLDPADPLTYLRRRFWRGRGVTGVEREVVVRLAVVRFGAALLRGRAGVGGFVSSPSTAAAPMPIDRSTSPSTISVV